MANIHDLGLGILKLLTNQVEKDNGFECWGDLEPHAKNMIQDIFPNANIEVHPLAAIGFKIFEQVSSKRQRKLQDLMDQKLLVEPKEEIKNDTKRPRGYTNI